MPEDSIFTRIIRRELPAMIRFEDDDVIVIDDMNKDAPVHLLGITKKPYASLDQLLGDPDGSATLWRLMTALRMQAHILGIEATGYRFVSNIGADAHQVVPHLHVHLLGGAPLRMADPPAGA